jgi:hypothetical protein
LNGWVIETREIPMLILFLSAILWAESPLRAEPIGSVAELARYFRGQILKVDSYAQKAPALDSGAAFPLHDIHIDLAPTVSFGIIGVLQLSVSPEIDFVLVPDSPAAIRAESTQSPPR